MVVVMNWAREWRLWRGREDDLHGLGRLLACFATRDWVDETQTHPPLHETGRE